MKVKSEAASWRYSSPYKASTKIVRTPASPSGLVKILSDSGLEHGPVIALDSLLRDTIRSSFRPQEYKRVRVRGKEGTWVHRKLYTDVHIYGQQIFKMIIDYLRGTARGTTHSSGVLLLPDMSESYP